MKRLIISWTIIFQTLSALPQSPSVLRGTVDFQLQPDCLAISASNGSAIEWESFSVREQECAKFIQPSAESIVLNRIIGSSPSELLGRLEANGQILLINQNGIIFGKDAQIHVGSLIASTMDLEMNHFREGNWIFHGDSSETISQMGEIHARNLFFVGKSIEQIGSIQASDTIGIGLGKEVRIQPSSDLPINVFAGDSQSKLSQRGEIKGRIFISAPNGQAAIAGNLVGSEIRIGAETLYVEEGARVTGPLIHFGEKEGIVKQLICAPNTVFCADASSQGDGGEILLWAKEEAHFHGLATARGGKLEGNGGNIELSSPGHLGYKGKVDTLAPNGKTGHFLLDPSTINITNSSPSVPPFANPYDPAIAVANLDVADLNAALMSSSVTVATSSGAGGTGDINVQPFAIITVDPGSVGDIQLRLYADNDLNIQESISAVGPCSIGPQFDFRANANGSGTTGSLNVGFAGQVADILLETTDGGIRLSGKSIQIGDPGIGAGHTVKIRAQGANGTVNVASTQDYSMLGIATNGPSFPQVLLESSQPMGLSIGGNCNLIAGTGAQASVQLLSNHALTLTVTGDLNLEGGSGFNNDSQVFIDSAQTQNINVAGNIHLLGGSGSNTDVTIQTTGTQTIHCNGLIDLQGGPQYTGTINGTRAQFLSNSVGVLQEIRANRLHMTGGEDVNSDAFITSNGPQSILIAQDIIMQAGAGGDPSVNGTGVHIRANNSGPQTVNCSSLSMITGFCINSSVDIYSSGDQTISASGPISLLCQNNTSTVALIRSDAIQTISGTTLTLTGESLINITMAGAQYFSFSGNVILQSLPSLSSAILTPFGFNNPQIALIGGDLSIIGNVGATTLWENGSGSLLEVGGDLTLLGNGGSIDLSSDVGGNTEIRVGGDLLIDSTTGSTVQIDQSANFLLTVDGNAVIGTSTSQAIQRIVTDSPARIAVQGTLTIEGGSGAGAASLIGQSNFVSGTLELIVRGKTTLLGGIGSDAQAQIQTLSDTVISIGNDLSIMGGSGQNAWAVIETLVANQQVFVAKSIQLTGGSSFFGAGSYAAITNGVGVQQVSAGQDIFLTAGNGGNSNHAVLGAGWFDTMPFLGSTTPDNSSSTVSAFGSIISQNSASGSRAYFDLNASGVAGFGIISFVKNGALSLLAGGNLTMATSFAATENAFTAIPQDFIYINSDQNFTAGSAWPANGHPFLAGTPLASSSPAQGSNGLGGFQVSTGPIGGPISLTSQRGDIYLSSAERFLSGNLDNLVIGSANDELTLNSITGDISVDPFHNITITNSVTTGGDVFMIAQNDISMTSTGLISAGGSVILVCDNQFPAAPLLGPGAFQMDPGSSIVTGTVKGQSPLQIFTSRRSQNSISGTLNGVLFSPGPFLTNSLTEQWCVYYPDPFFGGVYTIFYKECLATLTLQAEIIDTQFLFYLHPMDEHLGRQERFSISYYEDADFPLNENYQIRRRKMQLFHYPNESTALFW